MDYFEATVARILEEQGYWVRQSVRVELSQAVRNALGKPSLPRCEIDIVAYQPTTRELILFEVKSFLDSHGVKPADLQRTTWTKNRYKLLTIPDLRRAVSKALVAHYRKRGLIDGEVRVRFGLAAGRVKDRVNTEVRQIAKKNRWVFLGPKEIAEAVWKFAELRYENSPFVLTAKLLRRHLPKDE